MSRGPDIGTLLTRMLERLASAAACPIIIEQADWERWASATFSGARHAITLSAGPSDAFHAWLAGLAEQPVELPGHLVADLVVGQMTRSPDRTTVNLEVLTVQER